MKFANLFKKEFPGATMVLNTPVRHNPLKGRRLHTEGYCYNVAVYRCVTMIIRAMKHIEIHLERGEDEIITKHPVLKLLKKPNPKQSWPDFLQEAFVNWLIIGEIAIASSDDKEGLPQELWNFDPLEIEILPGRGGMPAAYRHNLANGAHKDFPVNFVRGESQMFFWRNYNPLDKWRGMSPLRPASLAADTNNAGLRWNYSLLKKGTRPSGIVRFKGSPDETVLLRMRKFFKEQYQGDTNSGDVPILTGDAEFTETGKNPKEMDFVKTLDKTLAYVAMAYGIPLPLVLNEAATFNNYREAKELFYLDAVLPDFNEFLDVFGSWLLRRARLEEGYALGYDPDSIPALEGLRERRNERLVKLVGGGIISPDEARAEIGYEPRGGVADSLFMPASTIPIEETRLPDDADDEEQLKAFMIKAGYSEDRINFVFQEIKDHALLPPGAGLDE